MSESPSTRPSLLARIRDRRDREAWDRFVEIYAPLVYGFARRYRLQDADAADLTQDVLSAVAGAVGRLDYGPATGSFRGWLFTIARNKLRNFFTSRRRHPQASGDSSDQTLLEEHPDREAAEVTAWDREYDERLFRWAAEQSREHFQTATWQAFWYTAVEGRAANETAKVLGMSVGSVYVAKSRVLAHLRDRIRQLRDSGELL